jgi:transcriptional regulator with GAF, ATPase, and Fis domain
MGFDKLKFFREFTLRICSSNNTSVSLQHCFEYLKEFIDCDAVSFHLPEPSVAHIVAAAGDIRKFPEVSMPPLSVPLPENYIHSWHDLETVTIVNDFHAYPVYQSILEKLGIDLSYSCIIMKLELGHNKIGSFWVWSKSSFHFSSDDVELLLSIREPLALGMSNGINNPNRIVERDTPPQKHLDVDDDLIGEHGGMRNVMDKIQAVACYDSPVLLYGETGVGKEVVAKMIHTLSNRNRGPFVKVNCGAIPESQIGRAHV